MPPNTNQSWPPGQQLTGQNHPAHWWSILLAHKFFVLAGFGVAVLLAGGIIFMVTKQTTHTTSPTTQQPSTNNTTSPTTNPNNSAPNTTSDKTTPNATKPKATSNTPTQSSTSQNGSSTTNSGSSSSGGSGTITCATSTPHVPDGPDGMGGCWPGPSNTGPNASEASMATYSGSCTINTANVVIDSKVVNCSPLSVGSGASGLVIKNSYIKGGVISQGTATFTIQDSQIDNAVSYPACGDGSCSAGQYACGDPNNATTECGVGYKNFTILRTEIMHTNRAAYCESTCTIQDSYFHGTNLWPDATNLAHASSVRNEQYLTLRHNSLGCDYAGPFPNGDIGCSADMSGYPDFAPITHDTIDKNLFLANNVGVGFCVYGGGTATKPFSNDPANATYISFTDNIFQRGPNGMCGAYGPVTDFVAGNTGNVWSGNKYDNGATVDAF